MSDLLNEEKVKIKYEPKTDAQGKVTPREITVVRKEEASDSESESEEERSEYEGVVGLTSKEISDVSKKYQSLKAADMQNIAEIVNTKGTDEAKAEAVASIVKESEEKGDHAEAGKIAEVGAAMAG